MPAETVGGLWIKSYEMTRSFGIEPGSASGTGVLPEGEVDTGLVIGDYVAYSFGGAVFYGLLSSIKVSKERQSGNDWSFSIVDNRIRLRWMLCFGMWNTSEDRNTIHGKILPRPPEGEFTSGALVGGGDDGVDFGEGLGSPPAVPPPAEISPVDIARGRVYSHIVPSQWQSQLKCYTNYAVSAEDIIRSAEKAALGTFQFDFSFHASQDKPVFDVDANSGISLAALLDQITSAQGLQVTIDGPRTLRWERRGEGTLVIPPPPAHLQEDGLEMSAEATKVRVVGDRILVQMNGITLEPDWKIGWQAFISEPAWLDELKDLFTLSVTTSAQQAELAALSREITLAQYIKAKGVSALSLADYGTWDQVSRMNMPVWAYLNQIVFRSYRIPVGSSMFGLPLRALEIHENLLCAVEITGDEESAVIGYRQDPVEYYPQASAFVIGKGQPIDLLNFMDREEAAKLRTKNLSNVWSPMYDFALDAESHSIRFSTAVFKDGDPESDQSILLFPNLGKGGYQDVSAEVDPSSDWLLVVVPNPDYLITPAEVKVSLSFRLGKFYKDYGTGQRWKSAVVPNVSPHLLLMGDGDSFAHEKVTAFVGSLGTPESSALPLKEILYEDDKTAEELADDQAEGLIQLQGTERKGRYTLYGAAGTLVSGVINRVTMRLDFNGGLSETVEFAKPRYAEPFVSSREFSRRLQTDELFSGQKELDREVRTLKAIAKLEKSSSRNEVKKSATKVITDIARRPLGGENAQVKTYLDINAQFPDGRGGGWRAGDLLWLDDAGLPSRTGSNFGGVVVVASETQSVIVSTSGIVPTAVKPGTTPESPVTAIPGEWFASNEGTYPIGMLHHGSPAPGDPESIDAVIGLVRLGGGGGGSSSMSGPFCKVFKALVGEVMKWKLLGGVVSGGSGNITIPDIVLGDVASPPADGTFHWIDCSFTALTESGLLMPGGDLTSAVPASGLSVPANDMPTGASPAGSVMVVLGQWSEGKFEPSGCGNIEVTHCIGNLSYNRL